MTAIEPFGKSAVFTLSEIGNTEPLKLRSGLEIEPFYFYSPSGSKADREYLTLKGDLFHEMRAEGVYDEGLQWAEMNMVRFSFRTTHSKLGDIFITADHTRSTSRAYLFSLNGDNKFPFLHRSRVHLTATASNLPGVVLQNQGVPIFLESDELDEWPTKDAIYRFKFQVPFVRRDNPDDVVIMLNPGAMRISPTV